jgi:hypothetical protein
VSGCRQLGRAPFGYPPRLRSGLRQKRAGFLEKREKGCTPSSRTAPLKPKPGLSGPPARPVSERPVGIPFRNFKLGFQSDICKFKKAVWPLP